MGKNNIFFKGNVRVWESKRKMHMTKRLIEIEKKLSLSYTNLEIANKESNPHQTSIPH